MVECILFEEKFYFENQKNIVDGIAINPLLSNDFYNTANEDRDINELAHWWGRPFIVTESFMEDSYEEYCERMSECKLESLEEFTARRDKDEKSWNEHWSGGVRYDVLCLTGGAWDRPSTLGHFSTLEEALVLAKEQPQMYQLLDAEGFLDLPIMMKEAMIKAEKGEQIMKIVLDGGREIFQIVFFKSIPIEGYLQVIQIKR